MIKPPRLQPGDRVAIVAPAGPVPRERFLEGAKRLADRYALHYDERIFDKQGFLAGDDRARRDELSRAIADPSVRAIICARGGYGLLRILGGLDPAALARAPKIIVGFSDVTVLHAFAASAGVASIHGPVVTQLALLPEADAQALIDLLESPAPPPPLTGLTVLAPGVGEGPLLGGNLELVSRLCGTPHALALDGAVLLLEEVGERPYRIDRALTQLALSGALAKLRGVVVGELIGCEEKDGAAPSALEVVAERLGSLGIPVLAGAPIGHGARNRAVPLGARVRLDAGAGTVEFLEAAVSQAP
jgi:muramoyltetrapeptide carboxypeptidase